MHETIGNVQEGKKCVRSVIKCVIEAVVLGSHGLILDEETEAQKI